MSLKLVNSINRGLNFPTIGVYIILAILISNWSNKIGVYIMRKIKKLTWLQTCFLGDVEVIRCNFLGDSLFQIYVMNFVEIMIAYYSHITLHVFQAFASCTHYTDYSLLNFVHFIVCDFVVSIQDWKFLDFNAKCVWSLRFKEILIENLIFGRSGFNTSVFEQHYISYSCILFIIYCALRSFCIKMLCFSKICFF